MSLKRLALSALVLSLMAFSSPFATSADAPAAASSGASIGVIDYQKLMLNYAKAKDFYNKDVAKRKELKELRDSLAEELKKGEKLSPVEQKVLEDKLNTQFTAKMKEYRDWAVAEDGTIQKNVDTAIDTVTKEQKMGMILVKPAVVSGGRDITDDVLKKLNGK
jgi:outer membrane protein